MRHLLVSILLVMVFFSNVAAAPIREPPSPRPPVCDLGCPAQPLQVMPKTVCYVYHHHRICRLEKR